MNARGGYHGSKAHNRDCNPLWDFIFNDSDRTSTKKLKKGSEKKKTNLRNLNKGVVQVLKFLRDVKKTPECCSNYYNKNTVYELDTTFQNIDTKDIFVLRLIKCKTITLIKEDGNHRFTKQVEVEDGLCITLGDLNRYKENFLSIFRVYDVPSQSLKRRNQLTKKEIENEKKNSIS